MQIDILTLFPQMYQGPFSESIIKRAVDKNLVSIGIHNIRDYALDKHKSVDDTPYGGGSGMVMRVDVIVRALESILGYTLPKKQPKQKIYLLSAKGEQFDQHIAQTLAKLDRLILIAGHYEGVDERLLHFIDGELSVGNFVLTGGELASMMIVDTVVRLLPGVISEDSLKEESFSQGQETEYPHYTKPQVFRDLAVPPVLTSGDHKTIASWRAAQKKTRT